jgi:hypothetical protein
MTETEALRQNYELGVIAGEAREKKRILELLESTKIPCDCGENCGYYDIGYEDAIAFIKGEK